jgi:lipopolysaccharide export system protein LptA
MRGTRWLLLVAIALILGAVTFTYRSQQMAIRAAAPAPPQPLPEELTSVQHDYTFSQKPKNRACATYEIRAASGRSLKDNSRTDLTDVTLKLYDKDCKTFNLIKTASASFFPNEKRFFAGGAVRITLKSPIEGAPKHRLVTIDTSGVTLNTENNHAETDQAVTFAFENGDGKATGAFYDPDNHELQLKKDVVVHRHPPGSKAMTIEAGNLIYHEATGEVVLTPWGRLTRENTVVEGENPVIKLRNREYIQQVHAGKAHGVDTYPNRRLQYSADDLLMDFDDKGEVQRITATNNAHLVQSSESSETNVDANYVVLAFDVQNKESILKGVSALGNAVAKQRPLAVPGREPGETHILRSEDIQIDMRPGGRDIQRLRTQAPGTLEFLPNLPMQRHRILTGDNMVIAYGAQNRIDTFQATNVKTHTEPNEEERKRQRGVSNTASNEILARFDPKSSKMASMEQKGNFAYDEGERHARATRATLDADRNVIVLESGARLWDSSGSTTADRIRMDQRTGDFLADGNVNSSRMPDKDPKKNSQMLNGDEPLQAQAEHMESANHNRTIHYRGKALMWQGANRIQADVIDVDREKRSITADGSVVSNLWEQPKDDEKKKGSSPVLTVVRAPHLVYTDENRLAVYSGGVTLTRPQMKVKCRELRAYLAESGADSRLEKAFADGAVEIERIAPDRTRTGFAEHGEYYTADQKVVLKGGQPKLVDSVGGSMQAPDQLTYYADDGRLRGEGNSGQPVQSLLIRRKKK